MFIVPPGRDQVRAFDPHIAAAPIILPSPHRITSTSLHASADWSLTPISRLAPVPELHSQASRGPKIGRALTVMERE